VTTQITASRCRFTVILDGEPAYASRWLSVNQRAGSLPSNSTSTVNWWHRTSKRHTTNWLDLMLSSACRIFCAASAVSQSIVTRIQERATYSGWKLLIWKANSQTVTCPHINKKSQSNFGTATSPPIGYNWMPQLPHIYHQNCPSPSTISTSI